MKSIELLNICILYFYFKTNINYLQVFTDCYLSSSMDLSPFRQSFEKNRNRQKYQHNLKEHPKFTKIAKFGCEIS